MNKVLTPRLCLTLKHLSVDDYLKFTHKVCTQCKQTKDVLSFRRVNGGKLRPWSYHSVCRACSKKNHDLWRTANPDKVKICRDRWHKNNPDKSKAINVRSRIKYRAKMYGITEEQWHEMFRLQNGHCLLCGLKKKLLVDHCHKTGKARGLLCHRCNCVLGIVENYPLILERIKPYLAYEIAGQPIHKENL